MVCPYCRSNSQVTNSRLQRRANQVWRRRRCVSCGNIFTTQENIDLQGALRLRKGARELAPVQRDRLFISIYESCKHRANAVSDASALTHTILSNLTKLPLKDGLLTRNDIVTETHKVLQRFDAAAATMYLAYHPL